jgi:hypothetical protein
MFGQQDVSWLNSCWDNLFSLVNRGKVIILAELMSIDA